MYAPAPMLAPSRLGRLNFRHSLHTGSLRRSRPPRYTGGRRQSLEFGQSFVVQIDRLVQAVVDPRLDDPDVIGHQLDLGDPPLEVAVGAHGRNLLPGALNQDEPTQFGALWPQDAGVEAFDAMLVDEILQITLGRLEQAECFSLTPAGRYAPRYPDARIGHGFLLR